MARAETPKGLHIAPHPPRAAAAGNKLLQQRKRVRGRFAGARARAHNGVAAEKKHGQRSGLRGRYGERRAEKIMAVRCSPQINAAAGANECTRSGRAHLHWRRRQPALPRHGSQQARVEAERVGSKRRGRRSRLNCSHLRGELSCGSERCLRRGGRCSRVYGWCSCGSRRRGSRRGRARPSPFHGGTERRRSPKRLQTTRQCENIRNEH